MERNGTPDVLIGGKLQTEQFILGHMYRILIENYTRQDAGLRLGLAGTQIVFRALNNGDIHMYPEYTGTGLYVLLDRGPAVGDSLGNDARAVYRYVDRHMQKRYRIKWLKPLGFENTYAVIMRKQDARKLEINTISDLSEYLHSEQTVRLTP